MNLRTRCWVGKIIGTWKYENHLHSDEWGFYSEDHAAFEFTFSSGMLETVRPICDFSEETDSPIVEALLDRNGALLKLKRDLAGKIRILKRTNGTTMMEEEEAAVLQFAEDADLFALSDGWVFEVDCQVKIK